MTGLTAGEVTFVLASLKLPSELRSRLLASSGAGLELRDEEVDSLLELVSDRVMTHGFDAAYQPTEEGRALERLIDRLSVDDSSGVEPRARP